MTNKPAQNQDKFIVRLPDGMRDRIKRSAQFSNRSMNAEIVWALERLYPEVDAIAGQNFSRIEYVRDELMRLVRELDQFEDSEVSKG